MEEPVLPPEIDPIHVIPLNGSYFPCNLRTPQGWECFEFPSHPNQ